MKAIEIRRLLSKHNNMALFCLKSGLFLFSFIVISLIVFRSSGPKGAKHETTLENTNTAKNRAESLKSKAQIASTEHKISSFINKGKNQKESRSHHLCFQDLSGTQTAEQRIAKLKKATFATNWGKESDPDLRAFSRWADNYSRTASGSRSIMIGQGLTLAEARRKVMIQLIAQDPAQAIASSIPASLNQILPIEILELAERRISGIGDLDVIGVYPKPNGPKNINRIERFARFDNESYMATVYGQLANIGSREKIPLHGVVIDDRAALLDSFIRILETDELIDPNKKIITENNHPFSRMMANRNLARNSTSIYAESGDKVYCLCSVGIEGLSNISDLMDNSTSEGVIGRRYESIGQKKLLVMLVDFSDLQSSPIDNNSTFQQRLNSVNDYFRASSSDQFYFSEMAFTPVMRMPQTASYYRGSSFTGRVYELYNDAVAKAREIGYEANDYHFDVVAFDTVFTTGWAGLGSIGAGKAWLNGRFYVQHVGVFVHELGHNLGLYHANAWNPNPNTAPDNPNGSHVEYGNDFDVMGDTYTYSGPSGSNADKLHFSASFKNALGWMPDSHLQMVNGNY